MYYINLTEIFRERQRALLEEAESRRLARKLRAGRTSKARSTIGGGVATVALGFLAALLLASLLVVAAGPAEAAGKFRTVTKTFSNATAITINSSTGEVSPYPSQVAVSGMRRGKILDVNVSLGGYSHTFPDDVDVLLLGPRGQNAIIMSDVGGTDTDANNLTLTLDDEAANSLPDNGPLVGGTYKPTNISVVTSPDTFPFTPSGAVELSTFDGSNPNGTWSLYVDDDFPAGDGGQLASGWSMQIKAKVRR